MAMLRSVLGRVSRRLLGSAGVPSVISRCGPEILDAPQLPSLRRAAPWMPRPGPAPQLMRTFSSPAAAAAAAAAAMRTRRIPNLQGRQHFPVIPEGTKGMKCAEQKRFLWTKSNDGNAMEFARRAVKRFKAWNDVPFDPVHEYMAITFVGVAALSWTISLSKHRQPL